MRRSVRVGTLRLALVAASLAVVSPGSLWAQVAGEGFLFRQPRVSLKFETGYGFQRSKGDLFDFVIDQHTIGRRDFDSPYVGGELSVHASERWDLAFSIGHQSSSVSSEFRDYVDVDDLPIEQLTSLRLISGTLHVRYFLREQGRSIGQFAWVPASVVPFLGAGVGILSYRFEQTGDFVDFQTLDVFGDRFTTEGETRLARVSAGFNLSLSEMFVLTGEARYSLASGEVGEAFSGFDSLNLSGLQLVGGISVRF